MSALRPASYVGQELLDDTVELRRRLHGPMPFGLLEFHLRLKIGEQGIFFTERNSG